MKGTKNMNQPYAWIRDNWQRPVRNFVVLEKTGPPVSKIMTIEKGGPVAYENQRKKPIKYQVSK